MKNNQSRGEMMSNKISMGDERDIVKKIRIELIRQFLENNSKSGEKNKAN
jgi:hypothetical protein